MNEHIDEFYKLSSSLDFKHIEKFLEKLIISTQNKEELLEEDNEQEVKKKRFNLRT